MSSKLIADNPKAVIIGEEVYTIDQIRIALNEYEKRKARQRRYNQRKKGKDNEHGEE